jgi:FADH2-dependent halogenase
VVFDELGIHDQIKKRGYTQKFGAEFVSKCGAHVRKFYFREALLPAGSMAYQVLRSDFDHLVLNRAREVGADVREKSTVTEVVPRDDGYDLTVQPDGGDAYRLGASLLVDASGQETFLSSRLNLKRVDPQHRRFALFSHFRGVDRGTGDDAGNIRIIPFGDGHWFWVIPLANGITSVGVVVTKEVIRQHRNDNQGYFERTIDQTHALKCTMTRAERIEPVHALADFSYESSRFVGDRFLIVGDAAAFIDPVFSSGVLMAMSSARDAAKAIHSAFQTDDFSARALSAYEREHRRRVSAIFRLIRAFYRPAFLDMFMNPIELLELKGAVATMVAGSFDLRLRLRWRLELFFFIGWLRGHMRSNRAMSTTCSHGCSIHPAGKLPDELPSYLVEDPGSVKLIEVGKKSGMGGDRTPSDA